MTETYRPLPTLLVMAFVLVMTVVRAQPSPQASPRNPEDERTLAFGKAVELERVQQFAAAAKVLEALPRSPVDYLLDLRLGWLHYLQGNTASSCYHYERARVGTPRAFEPRVALLLPLLAQQRYPQAEQTARAILASVPDHYLASLSLTVAYRMQGKLDAAATLNARMLEQYPADAEFLLEGARTCTARGDGAEGRRLYRQLLLLIPDHPATLEVK